MAQQQEALIEVLVERKERSELARERRESTEPSRPKEIYIEDKSVQNIQLSPDERYVTFRLATQPKNAKRTIVASYVTESGFTEDLNSRTKVGSPQTTYQLGIYDIKGDTAYYVSTKDISGIYDEPKYLSESKDKDEPEYGEEEDKEKKKDKKKPREVIFWVLIGLRMGSMQRSCSGRLITKIAGLCPWTSQPAN